MTKIGHVLATCGLQQFISATHHDVLIYTTPVISQESSSTLFRNSQVAETLEAHPEDTDQEMQMSQATEQK